MVVWMVSVGVPYIVPKCSFFGFYVGFRRQINPNVQILQVSCVQLFPYGILQKLSSIIIQGVGFLQ